MSDISVIIFAGGKSSRMGQNKALLRFNNISFAQHLYDKFYDFNRYIICKDNSIFDFEANFIVESNKELFAPIVAIEHLLGKQNLKNFLAIGVDMPDVSVEDVMKLYQAFENQDVVVSSFNNLINPLFAIYSSSFLPFAKQAIAKQDFSLSKQILSSKHTIVDFDSEFTNLNYPHEYQSFIASHEIG